MDENDGSAVATAAPAPTSNEFQYEPNVINFGPQATSTEYTKAELPLVAPSDSTDTGQYQCNYSFSPKENFYEPPATANPFQIVQNDETIVKSDSSAFIDSAADPSDCINLVSSVELNPNSPLPTPETMHHSEDATIHFKSESLFKEEPFHEELDISEKENMTFKCELPTTVPQVNESESSAPTFTCGQEASESNFNSINSTTLNQDIPQYSDADEQNQMTDENQIGTELEKERSSAAELSEERDSVSSEEHSLVINEDQSMLTSSEQSAVENELNANAVATKEEEDIVSENQSQAQLDGVSVKKEATEGFSESMVAQVSTYNDAEEKISCANITSTTIVKEEGEVRLVEETDVIKTEPTINGVETIKTENEQMCVRHGCLNRAINNPEWEQEFCSNDCVILHCKNVFTAWVKGNAIHSQ